MKHYLPVSEFNEWYKTFLDNHGGPAVTSKWCDLVCQKHENIREKLGGMRFTQEVKLKNVQNAAPFEEVDKLTYELLTERVPGYFYEYGLNRHSFRYPVIQEGKFEGHKLSKHIQHWMENTKQDQETVDRVGVIMSKLGEVWAKQKTQEVSMYVNITTDPRAFVSLGLYHVDRESCFKQGGANQMHKYLLGQTLNSYIVLVTSKPQDEFGENANVLARFWGIADESLENWSLCNVYYKDGQKHGDTLNAVSSVFTELLGGKVKKVTEGLKVHNAYQNKVINWVFSTAETPRTLFEANTAGAAIQDSVRCYKCHTYVPVDEIRVRSGVGLCQECYKVLSTPKVRPEYTNSY